MRILLGSESYYPNVDGGAVAERQLAWRLSERGHAVEVVAPSVRGFRDDAEPDGPTMIRRVAAVTFAPYPEYRVAVRPRRTIEGIVRRFRPDLVHVHNPYPIGFGLLAAARARGIPVVGTNHLMPENFFLTLRGLAFLHGPLGRAGWRYLTRFYNRCDLVIAPTRTAVDLLRAHGLTRPARAVSNGVDTRRFRPGLDGGYLRRIHRIPPAAPVILATGRLGGEKSLEVLLRAFAVLGRDSGAFLVLSGRGPDETRLRRIAAALGIGERTRFVGFVPGPDLPALYGVAQVFAIASTAELQSIVTLEASAAGLPVVAADAGALPELVRDGENGFLVPPHRPSALASRLRRLLADRALRRRMGRASRRAAAAHDYERVIGRFERVYAEVLQSRRLRFGA